MVINYNVNFIREIVKIIIFWDVYTCTYNKGFTPLCQEVVYFGFTLFNGSQHLGQHHSIFLDGSMLASFK